MASTNQSPFYQRAEAEFHEASSDDERIACLEVMIKECPKHKSSENMLRNLTLRLKKLREKSAKQKKSGKSSQQGIKKADLQCVLFGPPNTGKSSLFSILSSQKTKTSPHPFTTTTPKLGTFLFQTAPIQVVDIPSIPNHDKSLVNATDTVLIIVDSFDQITKSLEFLYRSPAKKIIVFNKSDQLSSRDQRKIEATLSSKHKEIPHILISALDSKDTLTKLKETIFKTFHILRVYTKEPGKDPSKDPMILKPGATVKEVAEKILKGMSKKIKRTKIWGPSSKFPGQVVGINHQLADKDIVEFQTM